MNDLFSTEGLVAGAFVLFLGGNTVSWFAERVRLKEWAESKGVRIVKKEWGWYFDSDKGNSRFVGRGGRWHRIVVLDSSQYAYTAYIFIGGILATLLGRDPMTPQSLGFEYTP